VEFYLFFYKKNIFISDIQNRVEISKKNNVLFDKRSKLELYKDLIKNGDIVVPNIPPDDVYINYNYNKILPISGISNTKTILCNESGEYAIFNSDRFGFRNDNSIWEKNEIDLVILGDSHVQGSCVNDGNTIQEFMMKHSLFTVLSLGYSGHGPLLQLAALKEYAELKKPKKIIWFFNEGNDIGNLIYELKNPILKKYKNTNFKQNLALQQNLINSELKSLIKKTIEDKSVKKKDFKNINLANGFIYFFKLTETRNYISDYLPFNFALVKYKYHNETNALQEYMKILSIAQSEVKKWGGKVYFVYLPHTNHYFGKNKYLYSLRLSQKLIKKIKENNMNFIDLKQGVIDIYPNPKDLYPLQIPGHLNEKGYELISKYILKNL